ncbi:MAG TPA: hypothetical protein VGM90_32110 [Kofleriaceae bacterium]
MTPDAAIGRIERLLAEAELLTDPRARSIVHALTAALVELANAGLSRAVALGGPELERQLADDPLAGSLLVLAGTHPDGADVRARAALEAASGQLHACGVELSRVDRIDRDGDAGIRVVLVGERGTPVDPAKARAVVEQIVTSRAPDADIVEVELAGQMVFAAGFVPADRLRVRL